jgi:hypothetical protein
MHPSRAVRRLGRRNRGSTVQGLGDELGDEPADELCDGAAQLVTDGRLERLLRRGHTPESTTAESLPALAVVRVVRCRTPAGPGCAVQARDRHARVSNLAHLELDKTRSLRGVSDTRWICVVSAPRPRAGGRDCRTGVASGPFWLNDPRYSGCDDPHTERDGAHLTSKSSIQSSGPLGSPTSGPTGRRGRRPPSFVATEEA